MPESRPCSFCGRKIEPGTGKLYVKTDGKMFHFCSIKCEKNMIHLKRKDRETRWTMKYAQEKAVVTQHKKAEGKKKLIRRKKKPKE